jgi:cyclopropane fatty-acyl-phospholipid synthase-like methyltransferase
MAKSSVTTQNTIKYDIPYVPSSDEHTDVMIKLAAVKPGEKAVDLGSGEGKLVMALAKEGAIVTGVEIDPGRSLATISKVIAAGLQDRARVVNSSFWEQSLAPYDLIVLYGVPRALWNAWRSKL